MALDRGLLEELYVRYYNEVLLYVISLSKSRSNAEDIVANAFYKALISADSSIGNFRSWLFTVCRNEFFTFCRKNRHYGGEVSEALADDGQELVDSIIRDEQYRALYRAVSLLNETQREAIILFYFSGLSINNISKIMNKSIANVKVILHRARENIKEILEER